MASVIVLAAGNSTRMGKDINKQLLTIGEKPLLIHTLSAFAMDEISEIIIVTRKEEITLISDMVKEYGIEKIKAIVAGGATRQESVCCGLAQVENHKVLIHDGARPFVSKKEILAVLGALATYQGAIPAVPVKDTIKAMEDGVVKETLPRESLMAVQTPQGFHTDVIRMAHQKAKADGVAVTDDASVLEHAKIPVKIVEGDYRNIKITTPEDMLFANAIYKENEVGR